MTEPKPTYTAKRVFMLDQPHNGRKRHLVGWIPPIMRSRRLTLQTACQKELLMVGYSESATLDKTVCARCRKMLDNGAG
jgi:hypothetical protein